MRELLWKNALDVKMKLLKMIIFILVLHHIIVHIGKINILFLILNAEYFAPFGSLPETLEVIFKEGLRKIDLMDFVIFLPWTYMFIGWLPGLRSQFLVCCRL